MRAYLEITNICNRKCSFCPGTKRQHVFVPPEIIEQRLQKLSGVTELCLHVLGEPMLHPEFSRIAILCRDRGIPVILTTNGTMLSETAKDVLLSNPIFRQINFSLQALSDATVKRNNAGFQMDLEKDDIRNFEDAALRGNSRKVTNFGLSRTAERQVGSFDSHVLSPDEMNIFGRILSFCEDALLRRPELYLNLRLWNLDSNFVQPEQNKFFLTEIFRHFQIGSIEEPKFTKNWKSMNLKGRLYLHGGSEFEWPVNAAGNDNERAFCHGLSSQFGILADGSVVPCCLDSEGEIILGNIDRQTLHQILHSERAESIRAGFRSGKAVEPLCKRCTYRRRFKT